MGFINRLLSSGEAAVTYFESGTADLVILDMIMDPGIDGLETFRRIRQINPDQKLLPVLKFGSALNPGPAEFHGICLALLYNPFDNNVS